MESCAVSIILFVGLPNMWFVFALNCVHAASGPSIFVLCYDCALLVRQRRLDAFQPQAPGPNMTWIALQNWTPHQFEELVSKHNFRAKNSVSRSWSSEEQKKLIEAVRQWRTLKVQCTRSADCFGWIASTVFSRDRTRGEIKTAVLSLERRARIARMAPAYSSCDETTFAS